MADDAAADVSVSKPEDVSARAEPAGPGLNASEPLGPSATSNGDGPQADKGMTADVNMGQSKDGDATALNPAADTPDTMPKRSKSNAKKGDKRASGGIPEHKSKKLNRKKSMPVLHSNVKEGEHWYAMMKGFPPWPCIILSEQLLPLSLLQKRPVSARRVDGSWREDFDEGGKNMKDRRFPVMFLGTHEFAWQHNADLTPLVIEDVKKTVDSEDKGKKSRDLWAAYVEASENYDLEHYENELNRMEQQEEERQEEVRRKEEAKEAEAQRKAEKKAKAKAKKEAAAEDSDGVEKKSKKRKKQVESDDEAETEPPKSGKIKISLKMQEPEASPKQKKRKSTSKPQPAPPAAADSEEERKESPQEEETPLTEAERLERKQKTILYLRHKLQKGLLARDNPPKAEEMNNMAEHFSVLEQHTNLEADIIRSTKINKVLKVILKLNSIPREEDFQFKRRAQELLDVWTQTLAASDNKAVAPNGVNHAKEDGGKDVKPAFGGDVEMKDTTSTAVAAESTNAGAEARETET